MSDSVVAEDVRKMQELLKQHAKDFARLNSKQPVEVAPRDEEAAAISLRAKLVSSEFSGTKLLANTSDAVRSTTNIPSQLMLEDVAKRVKTSASELVASTASQQQSRPIQIQTEATQSRALQVRRAAAPEYEQTEHHRSWKCARVFSGHRGVPRAIAVDPSNRIFATGGMDNVIKIFDVATGKLLMNFEGHSHPIRGLAFSPRHPYLFSASEDKEIKCWDLELNQIVRHYHGHTAGVYCVGVHPTLDTIVSGGRDSTVRVWDMRTRTQVYAMSGHKEAVVSLGLQSSAPHVVSGSEDSMVRLWSLESGRCMQTLTYHKKGVRAVAVHPTQFAFASASTGSVKKCSLPDGVFMQDFQFHDNEPKAIVQSLATSRDGKFICGGMDDGHIKFWDWTSAKEFQKLPIKTLPGTLESEASVMAMAFDMTGERLFACVGDKTVQTFKPETIIPINEAQE